MNKGLPKGGVAQPDKGDALIGEYTDTGTLLRRYVHGIDVKADDPIAWYESSGFTAAEERFMRPDWQGSIVLVTDSSGSTALAVNRYDEYGIPQSTNAGRFQYTGQAWLAELGMYYYKARIYSPTLGRFLQTDPIGYKDQANLYAYVGNDPIDKSDPTGLQEQGIWIEEASGNEPLGHQSIGVGDPNGSYSTFSMGTAEGNESLFGGRGEVYVDTDRGGKISAYYPVSADQAAGITNGFRSQVTSSTKYNIVTNNCRNWSNTVLQSIASKLHLKQTQAPDRAVEPRTSGTLGGSGGEVASRGSIATASPGPTGGGRPNSSLPPAPGAAPPPPPPKYDLCAAHPGAC